MGRKRSLASYYVTLAAAASPLKEQGQNTHTEACDHNNSHFYESVRYMLGFPGGTKGKNTCLPEQKMQEMWVQSLGQKDLLKEGMATHCNILVCEIS